MSWLEFVGPVLKIYHVDRWGRIWICWRLPLGHTQLGTCWSRKLWEGKFYPHYNRPQQHTRREKIENNNAISDGCSTVGLGLDGYGYRQVGWDIEHLNMKKQFYWEYCCLEHLYFFVSILLMNWRPNSKNSGFVVLKRYSPQQIYFLLSVLCFAQ